MALLPLLSMAADPAPRILVHGHRGARAVRPENTLPAFEYASAQGVDVLELDVAVTADDQMVVSHDLRMNRKICRGPEGEVLIRKLTLAQVREWDCGALVNPNFPKQQPAPGTKMPTLDEVLALAGRGTFEFNIETKMDQRNPDNCAEPAAFARMLVAAIKKHGLEKRVMIQSFDWRTLQAVKEIDPAIRRSALYSGAPRDFVSISEGGAQAQIVSPLFTLVTREQVEAAHKAGLQVVPWTANRPEDWDKLIDAGVDAIISDDPAALIAHLKMRQRR